VETGDKPPYDCCYYEDYNWEYFGQDDLGLNVVIPNGHIVKVWSRTKVKHAGSDQGDANKCDIGGGSIKTFQTDDFDYYEGRLNMTYSVCCPEGYIYNSSLQACCSDILCKNIECFLDGGYWFYEACWYPSASGQTCDTRCNAVGRTCDPMSMQYTENNCRLHEKVFGVGPACEASAPSTNSVAPYLNLITGKYYYYNATDVINHFNCTHSGANLRRICPCS